MSGEAVLPGRSKGSSSGCPFCRNARFTLPQVGIRFRVLSGFQIGRAGVVVESPAPPPFPPTEFLAQMDGEPPDVQRRILPTEIIERFPFAAPPEWSPPLSLEDASELDSVVVTFCEGGREGDQWVMKWPFYYEVIRSIWHRRLPIEANELWFVLRAHGVPDRFETELSDFFVKGRELLIHAFGKKPVKKKRVQALSVV